MADRKRKARRAPGLPTSSPTSKGKAKGTPDGPLDRERTEALADVALARGAAVIDYALGLVAVPDLVLAQGFANGLPVPATVRLERPDGRAVSLYRWPIPTREVAR